MSDAWLEALSPDECVELLSEHTVGRIAVVVDDFPIVLPVNYRLVEGTTHIGVALRTRAGGVIERAPTNVAFQIDGIDPSHRQGWSVLVRGVLHHIHTDPDATEFKARFDPEPWILAERDQWLVVEPIAISGRRLHPAELEWSVDARAYL